jgi:hypothetical protein
MNWFDGPAVIASVVERRLVKLADTDVAVLWSILVAQPVDDIVILPQVHTALIVPLTLDLTEHLRHAHAPPVFRSALVEQPHEFLSPLWPDRVPMPLSVLFVEPSESLECLVPKELLNLSCRMKSRTASRRLAATQWATATPSNRDRSSINACSPNPASHNRITAPNVFVARTASARITRSAPRLIGRPDQAPNSDKAKSSSDLHATSSSPELWAIAARTPSSSVGNTGDRRDCISTDQNDRRSPGLSVARASYPRIAGRSVPTARRKRAKRSRTQPLVA